MAHQTAAPKAAARGRRDAPDATGAPAGPGPAASAPVSLDRLLTVVVLSPAQAALVAARVLAAEAAASGRGAGDRTRDADARWSVRLCASGEVEVTGAAAGEGARASELLAELCHNARQLPAHPSRVQLGLLRALEETTRQHQGGSERPARELERALTEAVGADGRQRMARDLAALVHAFARVAPSRAAPPEVPGVLRAPLPGRTRPEVLRRARHAPGRGRRSRRVVPAVVLLAVAVAGSGYVVLRDPGGGTAGAVARDATATAPSTVVGDDPARRPPVRPRPRAGTLAPRRAGAITGVEVVRSTTCTPGAPCPVTTTVRLSPAPTSRTVVWRVGTARWCGAGITWSPPLTVTARPGWTSVYADSSVAVPSGRSLALVAVTSAPDRVQSPPVPLTGSSLRC